MSSFIQIPLDRLEPAVLQSLLEEYASRDGTDYGEQEASLEDKVRELQIQLQRGEILVLFDTDAETWDILEAVQARALLQG